MMKGSDSGPHHAIVWTTVTFTQTSTTIVSIDSLHMSMH